MYLVCDDLASVWLYRYLHPADDFFVLRWDPWDPTHFALVLDLVPVPVREEHPEGPCHEWVGELRVHHRGHPHRRRHPRQSFKQLESTLFPLLVRLSDGPGLHTVVKVQVECLYAYKVPVRGVQSLGYAQ